MSWGRITLVLQDPSWRKPPGLPQKLKAAATAGLKASGLPRGACFTILLADDARLRALNRQFRGKDRPTNVLSFPAATNREDFVGRAAGRKAALRSAPHSERSTLFLADAPYVGDIALAYGVARDEAKAAGKRLCDHAAHLVVHGVLHLAGFDHQKPREAERMEGREVEILAGLGIADPYRVAKAAVR
jgi:probable rRNA maturation factor